jgi:hypothetical protein
MDAKRFAKSAQVLVVGGVKCPPVVNKTLSSGWHGLGKGSRVVDGETLATQLEYRETVISSDEWEGAEDMREAYQAMVEEKREAQNVTSRTYALRIAKRAGLTASDLA